MPKNESISVELNFKNAGGLKAAKTNEIGNVTEVVLFSEGLPLIKFDVSKLQFPEKPAVSSLDPEDEAYAYENENEELQLEFLKTLYENAKAIVETHKQERNIKQTAEERAADKARRLKERRSIKSFINGSDDLTDDLLNESD